MNERDAQSITRMVESGWSCDFGPDGRTLWCQMLYPFDAELATQAVVEMSNFPLPDNRFKPQVSDLRAIIIAIKRRTQGAQRALPAEQRGYAPPEWVWVWSWARLTRQPRENRGFPQQDRYADPLNMMTMVEYDELRSEWIAAGAPRRAKPLPF